MCGIFGAIGPITDSINKSETSHKMIEALKRRGPDYSDYIEFDKGFIGHTRLSLLDLSSLGNQPMKTENGNIISFNGEIYNHKLLSKKFNLKLISSSDTEVLIKLIEKIGFENAIKNSTGMFALAYFSPSDQSLYLCRDRMGEKPLYYYNERESIIFASDLNALVKSGLSNFEISDLGLKEYFHYGFIHSPNSIYKGVKKVLPGEIIKISFSKGKVLEVKNKIWFNLRETFLKNSLNNNLPFMDIVEHAHELILNSVKSQTFAHAKIGSFLSGGLDSSLITAMVAREINNLETFTIGSEDLRYDESMSAKKFANYLGVSHNLVNFNDINIEYHLDYISKAYDEPLADSSSLATSIVSKLASSKVKAVLTGDGGDELFGGYYRHNFGLKIWKILKKINYKSFTNNFFKFIDAHLSDRIFHSMSKFGISNAREKLTKIKNLNNITNIENYYLYLMSNSLEIKPFFLKEKDFSKIKLRDIHGLTDEDKLCFWDQNIYLPGDNLAKIDRMTMFHSLEARAPFLDADLVTFMNSVRFKLKNKFGAKSIIKKIHSKYFPKKLFDYSKKGFSIPLDYLMREKLKEWSFYWATYNEHDLFDISIIKQMWKKHQSGINLAPDLWKIICYNRWHSSC